MDANQFGDSRSSSRRRVVIADPSPQLVQAVRAQVALPPPDPHGHWELSVVRTVEVEAHLTRVTHQDGAEPAEQPIMWSDDRPVSRPAPSRRRGIRPELTRTL